MYPFICPNCGGEIEESIEVIDSGEPDYIEGSICPLCDRFASLEEWDDANEEE